MFSKGDKVSGTYKGEPFNAIITKVMRGGERCHFTTVGRKGGDITLVGPDRGLRPASFEGSLPEEPRGPILHVGDHVTTPWKGEIVKGVISKVGPKNVEMLLWRKPQGRGIVGHPKFFTLAQHEQLADPLAESLKDWEVRNYHYYPRLSEETNAISADIFYKGVKVMRVTNDGHGSSNQYDPYGRTGEEARDYVAEFEKAMEMLGDIMEPADTWVAWYTLYRPYGVTLTEHVKKEAEFDQALTKVSAELKAEDEAQATA